MNPDFQHKLSILCEDYKNKLPAKMQHLKTECEKLKTHWTVDNLKTFHREVHNLCGSAAMYGFAELSSAARSLESYLRSLDAPGIIHTSIHDAEIEKLLKNLMNTRSD